MAAYKNKIDRGYRKKPHYFILIVLSKDPLTGILIWKILNYLLVTLNLTIMYIHVTI